MKGNESICKMIFRLLVNYLNVKEFSNPCDNLLKKRLLSESVTLKLLYPLKKRGKKKLLETNKERRYRWRYC